MTTQRPTSVRFAIASDEDEIMRLMFEAYDEQPIFPLNEDKMREKIRICTALKLKDRRGAIGVIDALNGGLAGYIVTVYGEYWYTDTTHLEELSNFVHPEHRRSTYAKDLLDFAKWFAEQLHLPLLLGIMSTQRLEAKIRLYKRKVTLCGAVFVHNTGHVDGLLSEMG